MNREEFEDTKRVIRIRKLKMDRQHNGQKKKYKSTNTDLQNMTQITIPWHDYCPLSLKVTDIFQVDSILINVGNICNVLMNSNKASMQRQCHQRS